MIVLDTSILSRAFRRRRSGERFSSVSLLQDLIAADAPMAVPGIVLQELLSGLRSREQFRWLRDSMAAFPLLLATENDHVFAAEIVNDCRHAGITCTAADALIAALTVGSSGRLFTADADFQRIATCCGLELFDASRRS